jgi:hypothetical protein
MAKAKKKPAKKPAIEPARSEVDAKRAKAYSDMENDVCNLAQQAKLAMIVHDRPDLFLHAVDHLDGMAQRFRAHYYATDFAED